MSRSSSSRARKQNFSPNNNSNFFPYNEDVNSEDDSQYYVEDDCPPRRINRAITAARKISDPRDRQSQLDHNEQERGRRRELAIIYEMIRTCITEDDIRRHLDGTVKSADKLSYPQLLQISCGKIRDELHDQKVIRTLMRDIEALEGLCDELGISFEKKRPAIDPMERHKIIAEVVEDVLSVDKRSRTYSGEYMMSQRARAQIAHNKLTELLADVNKLVTVSQAQNYHPSFLTPRENRSVVPLRRPFRRNQRRSRRPLFGRRVNPVSPPLSPIHNAIPSPSPSLPHSPNEEPAFSPEIIEQVIDHFPISFPPQEVESFPPMISSTDFQEIADRLISESGDLRFEDSISHEEATSLLREFDMNGIEDLGFDSLFSLVNNGGIPDDLDADGFL